MPGYQVPGVFVEEVPCRARPIEGVETSTAGFVGPACCGPVGRPVLLTGLAEYERLHGAGRRLAFGGTPQEDYLWHAARAFFAEGGRRLYVSRLFSPLAGTWPPTDAAGRVSFGTAAAAPRIGAGYADGHGRAAVPASGGPPALQLRARFPGAAGNLKVRFTVEVGPEALAGEAVRDAAGRPVPGPHGRPRLRPVLVGLRGFDLVWIRRRSPPAGEPAEGGAWVAGPQPAGAGGGWSFSGPAGILPGGDLVPPRAGDAASGDSVRPLRLAVAVDRPDAVPWLHRHLAFDPRHRANAGADALTAAFAAEPADERDRLELPLVVEAEDGATGPDVLGALLREAAAQGLALGAAIADGASADADRTLVVALAGGNDGRRPTAVDYAGTALPEGPGTGLEALAEVDEVAAVAAPGSSFVPPGGDPLAARGIAAALVAHAERMRWRIAILDGPNGASMHEIRAFREAFDSDRAALYHPWVLVRDPASPGPLALPPSGFVAGICARVDLERGVNRAPANEIVRSAIGFESAIGTAEQAVLNPEGINCLRAIGGRGLRLWGARTAGSDPEWKYLNVRRYFNYLERSIDRRTLWAVFEANTESLWANLRASVEEFLVAEWRQGRLVGAKPEEAFFVRRDRATMAGAEPEEGRLAWEVGVAMIKPAEFVVLRVGQWTADRRS